MKILSKNFLISYTSQEHVTEYKTFPQNNGELILVGGSDKYNNLASGSDYGESKS
jgi:hypothetical protein